MKNISTLFSIILLCTGIILLGLLAKTYTYEHTRPESSPVIFRDFPNQPQTDTAENLDTSALKNICPLIRLSFTGDIMQHHRQMHDDFQASYAALKPVLDRHDLSLGMMEFPVDPDKPAGPPPHSVQFNGSPAHLQALKDSGFDLLNLSNNHSLDQGVDGALRTLTEVEKHGLEGVGIGSKTKTRTPQYITVNGRKLAFASFSIQPNSYPDETGDIAYWPKDAPIHELNFYNWNGLYREKGRKLFREYVQNAEKDRADFKIALLHWGDEWDFTPNEEQKRAAHDMIDAGFDMVIGSHGHVLNGLEVYKNKLIAYSLGNLISDFVETKVRSAAVLSVALSEQKDGTLALFSFSAIPTLTHREKNHPVTPLTTPSKGREEQKALANARHILGKNVLDDWEKQLVEPCIRNN